MFGVKEPNVFCGNLRTSLGLVYGVDPSHCAHNLSVKEPCACVKEPYSYVFCGNFAEAFLVYRRHVSVKDCWMWFWKLPPNPEKDIRMWMRRRLSMHRVHLLCRVCMSECVHILCRVCMCEWVPMHLLCRVCMCECVLMHRVHLSSSRV